eukprot:TRINITY_DN14729_c0_g1_i1.p1 TRINITY_DN14729_c0_g1~~TRINITY_DN14729_c0_g1_i1.p1  ORF type:complete len:587 (+),score=127.70 TRINITY_DN14729_c0_g1_i1:492-2252(+)
MEGPSSIRTKSRGGSGGESGSMSPTMNRQRVKQDVCEEVYKRLAEYGDASVNTPGFIEELQAHFNRLPTRYALDVNTERAEDVLTHKKLLELAKDPATRPAFFVRAVHLVPVNDFNDGSSDSSLRGSPPGESDDVAVHPAVRRLSVHPPPAFGSSPNLEALALDLNKSAPDADEKGSVGQPSPTSSRAPHAPMHEVTISTVDKPKLLSQLSALLADVGLNIREAHVFSTVDGYSLDVFVVDGWSTEDVQELQSHLKARLTEMENGKYAKAPAVGLPAAVIPPTAPSGHVRIPSDGTDDWEIDSSQLKLLHKVASGSFGDLFRGSYCGQDVAIKILKPERLNENLQQEFAQEVYIMRKVRHKNVVQFIGACTKPPNLSIVTEFMSGGSVYDYLHKQKAAIRLPLLLKIGIDVSKGMDYLHQNNIIHRDLKAANLLMDENDVVKVADFGVARVQAQSGIMTAETGTYRWMAPEVIEHRPYDNKADVFSFGIVLWELLTGKLPYSDLTPLQAAVGVVQKGLRPTIPKTCHPKLAEVMHRCWSTNPSERPEFSEVTKLLQEALKSVEEDSDLEKRKEKKPGGFFSALKRR